MTLKKLLISVSYITSAKHVCFGYGTYSAVNMAGRQLVISKLVILMIDYNLFTVQAMYLYTWANVYKHICIATFME
jgi:hypothetical protein